MAGKPGASGGARIGAGRPRKSYENEHPTGETPIEWIWRELAKQVGQEIANEIHQGFNERKRDYEKQRIDAIISKR